MPAKHRPKPAGKRPRPRQPNLAQRADKYDCYQRSVQCPEADIDFVDETFRGLRGRTPSRFREDFCGTAHTSCEWVRRRPTNIAYGFDLDPVPLEWGRRHNLSRLKPAQRARLHLRQTDVLAEHPDLRGTLDCVLAMNFSFWVFRHRASMLAYFKRVHEDLGPEGVFFLDFYGGPDAMRVMKDRRRVPRASPSAVRNETAEPSVLGFTSPFTYIWDQKSHNPIDGELMCAIHFTFPDGSRLNNAFVYHWRLWGLKEIREILDDAGFASTSVYWEGDDKRGGGNGVFTKSEIGDDSVAWVCYITAEK